MQRVANVYIGPNTQTFPLSIMVCMDFVAYTTALDPSVVFVEKNRLNENIGAQPLSKVHQWVEEFNYHLRSANNGQRNPFP